MCLNVKVVNQIWKSCALFAMCIYGRDIITRDCIKMSLWRAAAQARARTWVCGLLAVRRCQSLQGLRYPSKHPAALIPLRLLFLATTNVCAPHLRIATCRPQDRGTPSTVSSTVHTQFHPTPIFSLLSSYWSKTQISSLESQATEFMEISFRLQFVCYFTHLLPLSCMLLICGAVSQTQRQQS